MNPTTKKKITLKQNKKKVKRETHENDQKENHW